MARLGTCTVRRYGRRFGSYSIIPNSVFGSSASDSDSFETSIEEIGALEGGEQHHVSSNGIQVKRTGISLIQTSAGNTFLSVEFQPLGSTTLLQLDSPFSLPTVHKSRNFWVNRASLIPVSLYQSLSPRGNHPQRFVFVTCIRCPLLPNLIFLSQISPRLDRDKCSNPAMVWMGEISPATSLTATPTCFSFLTNIPREPSTSSGLTCF